MTPFPKYPKYKDCGVEWLGEVPEHWEVNPLRACAELSTERNRSDLPVLSVYREYGVIPKDSRDDNHNATSLDTSNYKVVHPGDLAVNKMKAWQGSLGVSEYHGIVSPAYITCKVNQSRIAGRYLHYLLRSKPLIGALDAISYGVRVGQWDMRFEDFKQVSLTYPPRAEQDRIVAFLDEKTAEIDTLIAKKQRQIELLDEQKAILINRAVTRGLHHQAELQDSGIEWLGPIPRHWEIKKLRNLLSAFSNKGHPHERLLSVTRELGVIERDVESKEANHNFVPDDLSNYKLIRKGDFVINKMKAWQGSYAVSPFSGIVSPAYFTFHLRGVLPEFFHIALRTKIYVPFFAAASDGVRIGQWDLVPERMREIPFAIPPPNEQTQIALQVADIHQQTKLLSEALESQIQTLQTLRSTLIAHAVTGKIAIPADTV